MKAFLDRNKKNPERKRSGTYRFVRVILPTLTAIALLPGMSPNVMAHQAPATAGSKSAAPAPQVKTYFCDGMWKLGAPDAKGVLDSKTGGNDTEFLNMISLLEKKKYSELLKKCLTNIKSTPDWLTSRLFCGLAYAGMDRNPEAERMLAEYQKKAGPDYDVPDCRNMLIILRRELNK